MDRLCQSLADAARAGTAKMEERRREESIVVGAKVGGGGKGM